MYHSTQPNSDRGELINKLRRIDKLVHSFALVGAYTNCDKDPYFRVLSRGVLGIVFN